ncbi:hypothetical protein NtB2_00103 [Lactococcus termiticola]|uniref:FeoB-associated Cys-rich membrane protein n=1 Tax=Lactococcus termiticola TaxID=2169526 RepID=A0A2R5HIT8_9LACT|nr:hypothetical protein NtB2_00103 [Lactococcus termiticola]
MNLSSLVLIIIIASLLAWSIRRAIKSKGACEDCHCSCPVNEKSPKR